MLLNQSSAIHTKSGCNKEERLTQLCVPADYLVLESWRSTQSMSPYSALQLILPRTSSAHPYLWLLVPLVTSNHKDKAVIWSKPAMAESRSCSADPNMTKSMSSRPSPLQPHALTLSSFLSFLPSPLSPLLKVANELWIPLIHILSKLLHLSSFNSSQRLTVLSLRAKVA